MFSCRAEVITFDTKIKHCVLSVPRQNAHCGGSRARFNTALGPLKKNRLWEGGGGGEFVPMYLLDGIVDI